jgi:hypothetical protein
MIERLQELGFLNASGARLINKSLSVQRLPGGKSSAHSRESRLEGFQP